LVCQSHFVSEPKVNRANHLSLQRALEFLRRWQPGKVYLVHLSCQDFIPGDEEANRMLKKYEPAAPLSAPEGEPYAIPRDQDTWQKLAERVFADHGLAMPVQVAWDGLKVEF
jgi:phosphoribosyl 1,2-cyclic phosphate phosphodiesterase